MSTSAAGLEPQDQLAQRMAALGVREEDIEESFVRSGGHGGQNVNKVATCVMLVHLPTQTSVKCQTTRQQWTNRVLARRLLLDKLEARKKGAAAERRDAAEKFRRQNLRRSPRAKAKMLDNKARQGLKKTFRRRVSED